jgi:Arc/MetJ-type ribon-helix-helix transcriptional regulator
MRSFRISLSSALRKIATLNLASTDFLKFGEFVNTLPMATYNISMNDELDVIVTTEMKRKKYANRSEFFRDLIRKQYVKDDYLIEVIDEDDPDYSLLKTLDRNEQKFLSPEAFKAQL